MNEQIVLEIQGVSRIYTDESDGSAVQALENINLQVKKGEFVSIIGASGCRKNDPFAPHCRPRPAPGRAAFAGRSRYRRGRIPGGATCFSRAACSPG